MYPTISKARERAFFIIMVVFVLTVVLSIFSVWFFFFKPENATVSEVIWGVPNHSEKWKEEENPYKKAVLLVPVPYTGFHCFPNIRSSQLNTNDLGLRTHLKYSEMIEEAKRLKALGYKIGIFTGGSAAFGYFSSNDASTIPGVLNALFVEDSRKVKFYNFGMSSYTSDQELASLVMYASALKPDILVVMDGHNDILHATYPSPVIKGRVGTEPYNVGAGIHFGYPILRFAYEKLTGVEFDSSYLDREYLIEEEETSINETALKETLNMYRHNLSNMVHFMRGIGGIAILSVQPVLGYRNRFSQPEDELGYLKKLYKVYPKMISTSKSVGKLSNAYFVDVTRVFEQLSENQQVFSDKVHMNDLGQRMVAEKFYKEILNILE